MKEADDARNSAGPQPDSTTGGVGDVEAAGETTAADQTGGAPDTRPVGMDTLADIKVSGARNLPEPES